MSKLKNKKSGIGLYQDVSFGCSRLLTKSYTTSFSMGIRLFSKSIQEPIYGIYGFVRLADEIVDTFHHSEQKRLLDDFKAETYRSIKEGVSTNPLLHAFQTTVNQYQIPHELIEGFLDSMYMDLNPITYDRNTYEKYIYGSAEVVGLMCLCVFVNGDQEKFQELEKPARVLGSVFQKVNFLRDIHFDYQLLNRSYFPNLNVNNPTQEELEAIFSEIEAEFDEALLGILKLPNSSKFGVYLGYRYFRKLFNRIKRTESERLLQERIRIPNSIKYFIFLRSYIRHRLQWYA